MTAGDVYGVASKAVVVLTYANWEGFYNECVRAYMRFLIEKGGKVRDTDCPRTATGPVDRLEVANEIIKRSVGPAAVPNSLSDAKGLTELAPVDAIDTVLKAYANGECDDQFVKTLLGLLGAKVNGLKIEQATAKKSADKVANPIGRPPSGKIV